MKDDFCLLFYSYNNACGMAVCESNELVTLNMGVLFSNIRAAEKMKQIRKEINSTINTV